MRICIPPRAGGFRHFVGRLLNGQFIDFLVALCVGRISTGGATDMAKEKNDIKTVHVSNCFCQTPVPKGHLLQMRESPAFHQQTVVPAVLVVPLPLDQGTPILSWRCACATREDAVSEEMVRASGSVRYVSGDRCPNTSGK